METAPRELPKQESDSLKLLKYLTEKLPGAQIDCQHDRGRTSIGVTPVNPKYWEKVVHLMLNAYAQEFKCAILSSLSNHSPCTAVILIYWKAPPKHETFVWPTIDNVANPPSSVTTDGLMHAGFLQTFLDQNRI